MMGYALVSQKRNGSQKVVSWHLSAKSAQKVKEDYNDKDQQHLKVVPASQVMDTKNDADS